MDDAGGFLAAPAPGAVVRAGAFEPPAFFAAGLAEPVLPALPGAFFFGAGLAADALAGLRAAVLPAGFFGAGFPAAGSSGAKAAAASASALPAGLSSASALAGVAPTATSRASPVPERAPPFSALRAAISASLSASAWCACAQARRGVGDAGRLEVAALDEVKGGVAELALRLADLVLQYDDARLSGGDLAGATRRPRPRRWPSPSRCRRTPSSLLAARPRGGHRGQVPGSVGSLGVV